MQHDLPASNVVIDWQEQMLEIKDETGTKYKVSFDKDITVIMVGYPDQEIKTMKARELGDFVSRGNIIKRIRFEEKPSN